MMVCQCLTGSKTAHQIPEAFKKAPHRVRHDSPITSG
jgi:hypothetical protein